MLTSWRAKKWKTKVLPREFCCRPLLLPGQSCWPTKRRRGATFVTRKISRAVARIKHGQQDRVYLGNLDACRDWGYAGDYVRAMWQMLQADHADDFVIATGETHSVREFCNLAFAEAELPIEWQGQGRDEKGLGPDGRVLIEVDPNYFRPAEVDLLLGDASKARSQLGWAPEVDFHGLVRMMVKHDLKLLAGKG